MADLQIAPPAPPSVLPAMLIAVAVLAAIAWAVFRFNPNHVADVKVPKIQLFAPHTDLRALESNVHGNMRVLSDKTATAGEDDLYVIATAGITDRLRLPLFLEGSQVEVTLADGQRIEPMILYADKLKRLTGVFPAAAPLLTKALRLVGEVSPGQTVTGDVVFLLGGVKTDAWATKKNATLTLLLRNQGPQTVALP